MQIKNKRLPRDCASQVWHTVYKPAFNKKQKIRDKKFSYFFWPCVCNGRGVNVFRSNGSWEPVSPGHLVYMLIYALFRVHSYTLLRNSNKVTVSSLVFPHLFPKKMGVGFRGTTTAHSNSIHVQEATHQKRKHACRGFLTHMCSKKEAMRIDSTPLLK